MASIQNLPTAVLAVAVTGSSGTLTPVAAVAAKKVRVWGLMITCATTTTITIKSDSTGLTGAMTLTAGIPLYLPLAAISPKSSSVYPWFESAAGEAIVIASAAVQVSGVMYYTQLA